MCFVLCCFFFFQAEDGIRDVAVTGVQTCALPIWVVLDPPGPREILRELGVAAPEDTAVGVDDQRRRARRALVEGENVAAGRHRSRSEERRVGEERRSRWSPDH